MESTLPLLAGLLAAIVFAYLTVRRGSLTVGGAVAAAALGALVVFFAGIPWLLPLLFFFLSSLLIGRLLPARGEVVSDAKDHRARDAVQVACNGGVYGLVVMLDPDPCLLLIAAGVATADTWASEIGKYFGLATYDILRLRRVPPGLSGGISGVGTLGGAAGALAMAGLGFWLSPEYGWGAFMRVSTLGFCGMVIDSVLGAALQARYRTAGGKLSDVPGAKARLAGGYRWMTNDLVNLLSIAATVGLAAAVLA